MSKSLLQFLFQGAAESGMNLLAQQNAQQKPIKKGSIAGGCRPCAAVARREAMHKKWRGSQG